MTSEYAYGHEYDTYHYEDQKHQPLHFTVTRPEEHDMIMKGAYYHAAPQEVGPSFGESTHVYDTKVVHHDPVVETTVHHEPVVHTTAYHEPVVHTAAYHEPVVHSYDAPVIHQETLVHHDPVIHHETVVHHEPVVSYHEPSPYYAGEYDAPVVHSHTTVDETHFVDESAQHPIEFELRDDHGYRTAYEREYHSVVPTHTHYDSWDVHATHPEYRYGEYYSNEEADGIGQKADAMLEHRISADVDPYAEITHYYQDPYAYSNQESDAVQEDAMLEHRGYAKEGHNPYGEVTDYYQDPRYDYYDPTSFYTHHKV